VFHLPEGPAASEPIQPLLPGGGVDVARLGRLAVRHDDSEDNVAHRLALWDKQVWVVVGDLPHHTPNWEDGGVQGVFVCVL
jgi:hypothetical protein